MNPENNDSNPAANPQTDSNSTYQPFQDATQINAGATPSPQNHSPAQQPRKYSRKNFVLIGVGLLFLLPIFIIQDPAMMGPALFFMFIVAPVLLILFVVYNINTYRYNQSLKRGEAVPDPNDTDTLAKTLIAAVLAIIAWFVLSIWIPPMGAFFPLISIAGYLLIVLAATLLIRCRRNKKFSTLSIVALSLYGVFMVGGYALTNLIF